MKMDYIDFTPEELRLLKRKYKEAGEEIRKYYNLDEIDLEGFYKDE